MEKRRALAVITLVLLLTACGGGDEPPAPCTDPVATTRVELADFAFRPDCLSVEASTMPMTFALENTGDAPHTFTVAGTDVDVNVDAGTSGEATLSGVESGSYAVTCTFHPQMEATLTVA
jgi:plastocyanin